MYRALRAAPASQVEEGRRGAVVGRFCHGCGSVYSLHQATHRGKPVSGKDHISSPCVHEGDAFETQAEWWETAVEIVPAPEPQVTS